jgi:hypothetical protein
MASIIQTLYRLPASVSGPGVVSFWLAASVSRPGVVSFWLAASVSGPGVVSFRLAATVSGFSGWVILILLIQLNVQSRNLR